MATKTAWSGPPIPRPAPTTYGQQEEQNAEDQWNQAGAWAAGDRTAAAGRRDATGAAASAALSAYGSRAPAPNVSGWSPRATGGYSAEQMQQWMRSAAGLDPNRALEAFDQGGGVGWTGGTGGGAANTNLKAFDPKALLEFDPTAAGTTFAKGAYGDFKNQLDDSLRAYQDEAIGAGRLRTGQYDVDKGQIVTRLGSDFSNKIAQSALDFSGQRLQALQAGTGMNLTRASDMDANARALQELNANLGLQRASTRGQLAQGAYTAATDRQRMLMAGAQSMDDLAFQKARALDTGNWDKATYLDTAASRQAETGLDAALAREGRYLTDYQTTADRSADWAGANRDWASRDREMEDLRAELERLRRGSSGPATTGGWGTGGARGGSTADDLVSQTNTKVANRFGVPFVNYG